MDVKRVWMISRNNGAFLDFYETRDEAVFEARALARKDRKNITGIYETFAGYDDCSDSYEPLWSDDFPEFNSINGLADGEVINDEELEDIIKRGRGMD